MYGDSLKDYVVMIGVLNLETANKYVKEIGSDKIQVDKNLCDSFDFIMMVYADMMECANINKLNSLERPKQLRLILEPFSVENDLLTPTMKLKRHQAKKGYEGLINKMYSEKVIDPKKVKEAAARSIAGKSSKKTD